MNILIILGLIFSLISLFSNTFMTIQGFNKYSATFIIINFILTIIAFIISIIGLVKVNKIIKTLAFITLVLSIIGIIFSIYLIFNSSYVPIGQIHT